MATNQSGNQKGTQSYAGQSQGGFNKGGPQAMPLILGKPFSEWKPIIQKWVQEGIKTETIKFSDAIGRQLKEDGLTTSQIRNVFGEMRRIQLNGFDKERTSFLLLRPKLAYAVKRQNARGLDRFYDVFCEAYDIVAKDGNGSTQYENLIQLMEAILAYHKFHGGQ